MKRIYISVGIDGRDRADVCSDINKAEGWIAKNIKRRFQKEEVVIIDSLVCRGICVDLSEVDIFYFVPGWDKYPECRRDKFIAAKNGIEMIFR